MQILKLHFYMVGSYFCYVFRVNEMPYTHIGEGQGHLKKLLIYFPGVSALQNILQLKWQC